MYDAILAIVDMRGCRCFRRLQILRGCLRAFRGRPGARGGADRSETLLPSAASTQVTHRPILVERALVGLGGGGF